MGISINIAVQLARIAPLIADCRKGVMLGRQKMHFGPQGWTPRLISELATMGIDAGPEDLFQPDGFCERYLSRIGWPEMEALDFSDIEGARYVHDLGAPIGPDLEARFDLVYDGGTTEHVFDIAQAFRNVDAMLAEGGIFVSCIGTDGWFGHGFYQVGPDIPWSYWQASLGYDVLGCWCFPRKAREAPVVIEDPHETPRGATRHFDKPQFLFYVVRKTAREGPPKPVIQSHYVDY